METGLSPSSRAVERAHLGGGCESDPPRVTLHPNKRGCKRLVPSKGTHTEVDGDIDVRSARRTLPT